MPLEPNTKLHRLGISLCGLGFLPVGLFLLVTGFSYLSSFQMQASTTVIWIKLMLVGLLVAMPTGFVVILISVIATAAPRPLRARAQSAAS